MKSELSDMINNAGIEKKELESSIGKAGEAKMALDSSIRSAGEKQLALDATVEHANTVDVSLKEHIGSAEQIQANVEQIATNKKDIASLKEDLSNKITKFYASNQGETHITDSDNGKIQDMIIYGRSSQFTTTGKNLANGQNVKCYINSSTSICGVTDNDTGMVIDASKLTNVTISTRSIQDRYRVGCTNTVPTKEGPITCYNGRIKDGTKDSYTIDTTNYNYLIVNATKLEDIQVEKGSETTSCEPYTGGIPSPNPDYPQEIKSVVNPVVKVVGKNVYNFGRHKGDYAFPGSSATAKVSENGSITIKGSVTDYASANIGEFLVDFPDGEYYMNTPKNNNVILQTIGGDGANFQSNTNDTIKFVKGKKAALYVVLLVAGTYNLTFTPMICKKREDLSTNDPYTEQLVQLPYTLNAIPVASGGNVTIDGQQYIADYVDLVRGVKVQRVKVKELNPGDKWSYQKLASGNNNFQIRILNADVAIDGKPCFCNILPFKNVIWDDSIQNLPKIYANKQEITVSFPPSSEYSSLEAFKHMLTDVKSVIYYILATPIETPLTQEEASAFKQLMTYYPVTNISVTSDQLDGYTVFNYPISMANGWNYVKQQLGDTRDYIYDMDAKAQDIDIQSAEAYVNSEYAVALAELEV